MAKRIKALYIIQQHKELIEPAPPGPEADQEIVFEQKDTLENQVGVFVDRADLGEFEDTAKALQHMRKNPENGTFRICAIKKQFDIKVETIIKAAFTDDKTVGDDEEGSGGTDGES